MSKVKIVKVTPDEIEFSNGIRMYSEHDYDCCENHWLDFSDVSKSDYEDLEFDLSNDGFFSKIPEYGIILNPIHGHGIRIPGYGSNNGYYGTNIDLCLSDGRVFDVSECQNWTDEY